MGTNLETDNVKVGLFGIGLDTYWRQFGDLRERLVGYQDVIAKKIELSGVDVVNVGLVDNPISANEAAKKFKQEDVSLIFLYVSTYALSSTVLPVVQKTNAPVVVLNLQPVKAINYAKFNSLGDRTKMTGEWLAHCQACSVPEIANVFLRSGIKFHQITGVLYEDPIAWGEIDSWLRATRVAQTLKSCRIGLLGHYYNGMLDIYSDLTRLSGQFGVHFEILEMCELLDNLGKVSTEDLDKKVREIHDIFDVQSDCPNEEIRRAAKTSAALDGLIKQHDLGAMAYFYNGTGDENYVNLIASVIVGNSILTSTGVPVAGEYEVKNVLAMKILDSLGVGGSFTEFYAMDFDDDVVLMGHDGPGHMTIAQGKTKLKPLKVFHGKVGQGLSVEMTVRHGAVTLLSVIDSLDGNAAFLIAEGESVAGQILEIGNTNSRYKFPIGARGFIDAWCSHGPAHHCAIGIGHVASELEKLAKLLGIKAIKVC
ncbi:MAG: L-fucose/L-arabinose isomerase family protein [Planctomycetaceae bacterium]|jgi:L-arabinose isomerase|nr:L-fucose/L-arabinose isomerase family protein [Planctomycetaceae bacterium]